MSNEKAKQEKKHVESKDFRTVFVNAFNMRFGENDVALMLSTEVADSKSDVFFQDEVRVMMTPRSAKVLFLILKTMISEFEKERGPIPMQEGKEEEIINALKRHT